MNKIQFDKGLKDIRALSMTPREKGEVFHKLHQYTEARPVPATSTIYASFLGLLRKVFVRTK